MQDWRAIVEGTRRQAIPLFAALWAVSKPVPGSSAQGASEQAKRTKPDLRLQQLLMKLAEQEEAIDQRIKRDKPLFIPVAFPSAPDHVSCIEDAADVAGFGKKAYHKRKSARVLLETWVIEEGLARLGDRRLGRVPSKCWPSPQPASLGKCDGRIRGRVGPGTRTQQEIGARRRLPRTLTPPTPPETIRMSISEYLIAREPYRLREEEPRICAPLCGRRARRSRENTPQAFRAARLPGPLISPLRRSGRDNTTNLPAPNQGCC